MEKKMKRTESTEKKDCNGNKKVKKRQSFSIIDKLNILKEIKGDVPLRNVAEKHKIPFNTLKGWKWNEDRLKKKMASFTFTKESKRIKQSHFDDLEEALYIWFDICFKNGIPLTGHIIKAKALELHSDMKIRQKFAASVGWLTHWKTKYNIHRFRICEERISASATEVFQKKFAALIVEEKLELCQIFNADEIGLYYKMMPSETLTSKTDSRPTYHKKLEDRLTVMLCSNADGTLKLSPVAIGLSANSGAMKNLPRTSLPVYYDHHRSSYMSASIFKNWFENEFVPKVKLFLSEKNLPEKAILLLNPCHPSATSLQVGNIRVKYLPVNIISVIQPMNQGIVENFKKSYKYRFLRSLINAQKKDIAVDSHLKSITIRDAINWIKESWDSVNKETIFKCWEYLLPDTYYANNNVIHDEFLNNEEFHGFENVESECVQVWFFSNDDDESKEEPSNTELIQFVKKNKAHDNIECIDLSDQEDDDDHSDADDDGNDERNAIKELAKNAIPAAEALLAFCKESKAGNESVFQLIKDLKKEAIKYLCDN